MAAPSLSLSIVMMPEATEFPGLAEVLPKMLNEKTTTSAAITITISAMISRVEFLPIHATRSPAVGWAAGSGVVLVMGDSDARWKHGVGPRAC